MPPDLRTRIWLAHLKRPNVHLPSWSVCWVLSANLRAPRTAGTERSIRVGNSPRVRQGLSGNLVHKVYQLINQACLHLTMFPTPCMSCSELDLRLHIR
ncbi:hypothetical protein PAXINDRAFT_171464 [Paxillus involutus ATCC 200175]|uniref:Uncharacterized protein n=1 Tax=Paxillus involutus ATCC 200175 TaxID=664439 RepID=A0A0C9T8F9_PAXIN|nr:hypothetical protein PAXINDRAFT_171464 [Paxillus involutus ATCC 200175]